MRHLPILALLLLASTPHLSQAQPAGERLIAPIPSTLKLAGQVPHDGAKIEMFVPANETIENWSEQIATQVRFNMASRTDLTALLHVIEQKWIEACKESPPITILPGTHPPRPRQGQGDGALHGHGDGLRQPHVPAFLPGGIGSIDEKMVAFRATAP